MVREFESCVDNEASEWIKRLKYSSKISRSLRNREIHRMYCCTIYFSSFETLNHLLFFVIIIWKCEHFWYKGILCTMSNNNGNRLYVANCTSIYCILCLHAKTLLKYTEYDWAWLKKHQPSAGNLVNQIVINI